MSRKITRAQLAARTRLMEKANEIACKYHCSNTEAVRRALEEKPKTSSRHLTGVRD